MKPKGRRRRGWLQKRRRLNAKPKKNVKGKRRRRDSAKKRWKGRKGQGWKSRGSEKRRKGGKGPKEKLLLLEVAQEAEVAYHLWEAAAAVVAGMSHQVAVGEATLVAAVEEVAHAGAEEGVHLTEAADTAVVVDTTAVMAVIVTIAALLPRTAVGLNMEPLSHQHCNAVHT